VRVQHPVEPERLPELFARALAIDDAAERAAFLEQQDQDTRDELSSLLDAHARSGDFLEEPALAEAVDLVPDLLGSALVGTAIGPWRVDALLHSGGMGSVFEAYRTGEDFRQRAALKLVKVGFESADLVARFSRERQLLAGLEHPNIARLLDGGTTGDGLPWLAMDFVDGAPVDSWADRRRLSLVERLELFDQVLDAIAYLHQNLITHRDIKPSNVLVDRRGQVKVLDFGVASLLGEAGAEDAPGQQRLSLGSAAPEQLRGGAVSTATDVYGLGVLLYRLLAGVPPYRITAGLERDALEAIICEQEPPPLSRAALQAPGVSEHAARMGTTPRRLARSLAGDLDAIVATCLRKPAQDRYRSVAELREDLRRHRERRPIEVRRASATYRVGRFLRRHWRGLAATMAIVFALAVGLTVALWQAEEARHQRDRALAVTRFLQEVLAEADPYEAGIDRRVRDVLSEASALLEQRFAGQPLLEAALRQSVGGVQATYLQIDAAEANLLRALELLEANAPADDEMRLRTEVNLAWIDASREDYAAAEARYLGVIERLHDGLPAQFRALPHNDLGVVYNYTEDFDASIEQSLRALEISPDTPDRVATLVNLGYAYDGLGDLDEASRYYLMAIERLRALGDGGRTTDLAHALNNYGNVLSQQDRDDEALPYYLESLAVRQRASGPDSDSAAIQHLNIGRLLLDMQRPAEALPHLARAVELFPRYRDEDSLYLLVARASHARAVFLTGDASRRAAATRTLGRVLKDLRAADGAAESRFAAQIDGWLQEAAGARSP
jgi:tetratricopeptide (TPR) repeat protein